MTIKRTIYRIVIRLLEKLLMLHSLRNCDKVNYEPSVASKDSVDIITIAFNNADVIAEQIRLIKKYIVNDSYCYMVVDNSTKKEKSEEIKALCISNNVTYIKLPKNRLNLIGPSYSHGASLNWIYENIVKTRKPSIFGFLDHDIFPITEIDINNVMGNLNIYGVLRDFAANEWYIWPGLCFFRRNFVENKELDFLPVKPSDTYLDTGGGNWYSVYSKISKNDIMIAYERKERLRDGDEFHGDFIQYIDERWIHSINGSNWKLIENKKNKEKLLKNILSKY